MIFDSFCIFCDIGCYGDFDCYIVFFSFHHLAVSPFFFLQERDDLELNGNTLKLTVKPDKKDWNAERPAKQINSSSIAKNKVVS